MIDFYSLSKKKYLLTLLYLLSAQCYAVQFILDLILNPFGIVQLSVFASLREFYFVIFERN